ncbi:TonB-dependent receptor, partial [bacterium]|nr:TonB-dependent receptor [bacterium]
GIFNDYSSKLFIRGSPPGQLLFLLDGVPVEMPYHLFGMAGVFSPEIIERVNLSSGVFSARFGDRVGGVVDIQTRSSASNGLSGVVNLNPATTSLALHGRLSSHMSVLLGGRYSHHNFASQIFRRESTPYYFGDFYSKLIYRLGARDRLALHGFYSGDRFLKRIPVYTAMPDQSRSRLELASTEFSWHSWRIGTNWIHEFSRGSRFEIGYSRSQNFVKDGENKSDIPTWAKDNFTNSYIARQTITGDLTQALSTNHRVRLGSQLVHHKLEYAWRRLDFQMASAILFEHSPPSPLSIFFESAGDELDYRKSVLQLFSYIEHLWQPSEKLTLETGLRFAKRSFVKDWTLSPRVNLGYKIRENIQAKAAYGKFYQGLTTAIDDTLLYMLPLLIPLEGDLRLQTANHYLAGLQMELAGMQFSVEGYYKKIENQLTFFTTASDTAFQKMIGRSILSRNKSLNITSRLSQGTARDFGVEFSLQRFGSRLNLNLNYTLSYSKQDLPSIAKLHGNFSATDQRHLLKAFSQYRMGRGWNLGLRWLLTSGRPMLLDGNSDGTTDSQAGLQGCTPQNPCRYPTYHRLDINLARNFRWNGWKFTAYLQLPDIYRRRNIESLLFYELDWGQGSQPSKQLLFPTMPVVPTFGISVEF